MQARLDTYGIKTIGQIAALPAARLSGWFGKSGQALWELANAIDFTSLQTQTLELPMDGAAWETKLQELIANSTLQKETRTVTTDDFAASFRR
jgi:nucleotidyltransferase/DNA polymerase involved in DNA repair